MPEYRIKQGGVVVAGSNSAPDILHYAYLYVEDDTVHVEVKDGKRWKSFCTIRKEQTDGQVGRDQMSEVRGTGSQAGEGHKLS